MPLLTAVSLVALVGGSLPPRSPKDFLPPYVRFARDAEFQLSLPYRQTSVRPMDQADLDRRAISYANRWQKHEWMIRERDSSETSFTYRLSPSKNGILFDNVVDVTVDAGGRLKDFAGSMRSKIPRPPKDMVVKVSPERAVAIAAIATTKHLGFSPLLPGPPPELAIKVPLGLTTGSETLRLAEPGQGALVYDVRLGHWAVNDPQLHVQVDATSGQVLSIFDRAMVPKYSSRVFDYPAVINVTEAWSRQQIIKHPFKLKITTTPQMFLPFGEFLLVTPSGLLYFELGQKNLGRITVGSEQWFFETADGTSLDPLKKFLLGEAR